MHAAIKAFPLSSMHGASDRTCSWGIPRDATRREVRMSQKWTHPVVCAITRFEPGIQNILAMLPMERVRISTGRGVLD